MGQRIAFFLLRCGDKNFAENLAKYLKLDNPE